MTETPDACPKCGSERVAHILYGLPDFDPGEELERQLDAGEVVLGGCMVSGDDFACRCVECGHEWGEPDHRA